MSVCARVTVLLMLPVLTLLVASPAPVTWDTLEMALSAQGSVIPFLYQARKITLIPITVLHTIPPVTTSLPTTESTSIPPPTTESMLASYV